MCARARVCMCVYVRVCVCVCVGATVTTHNRSANKAVGTFSEPHHAHITQGNTYCGAGLGSRLRFYTLPTGPFSVATVFMSCECVYVCG